MTYCTSMVYSTCGLKRRLGVSQHLRVLRESGFANVRVDRQRRIYSVDTAPLQDVDHWLDRFGRYWEPKLSALETEIARGKKKR